MMEEEAKMIADKMWRASQSKNTRKVGIWQKNLNDLLAAVEDNWWERSRESSA